MGFAKQRIRLLLASTTHLGSFEPRRLSLVYIFKEHDTGLNASSLQNLLCALHIRLPKTGGASRDRTDDPLLAKQVLSQLSYGPIDGISKLHGAFFKAAVLEESGHEWPGSCRWIDTQVMVGLGGLEPPASPLSGVRSNHLSYRPIKL